jgi:HlyD family secretion protein
MWKTVAIAVVLGLCSLFAGYAGLRYLGNTQTASPRDDGVARGEPTAAGETAGAAPANTVTALGRLEPAGSVLEIGGPAGDRLEELKVQLGDPVEKGQELAILGSHALREAELKLAEEQLAEAHRRAKVEEKHAATLLREADLAIESVELQQLDIASQQSKIELVQANLKVAQADLARLQGLRGDSHQPDRSIVSDQQLEQQALVVQQAEAELAAARSLLKKLQESFALAKAQAEAQLETARANRERIPTLVQASSLEKSVELARVRLATTVIKAPSGGRILAIFAREGETLATQPMLQMADTKTMVVVAEVYEDQALRIKAGQPATISSTALPQPLKGEVVHVGTMIARNLVVSLDPTASADKRVVEARIALESNPYAAQLINLQVTAEIDTAASQQRPRRDVAGGQPPGTR